MEESFESDYFNVVRSTKYNLNDILKTIDPDKLLYMIKDVRYKIESLETINKLLLSTIDVPIFVKRNLDYEKYDFSSYNIDAKFTAQYNRKIRKLIIKLFFG